MVGSSVVFYTIIFALLAVLLVVAGITLASRNRRKLEAERKAEAASASTRRRRKATRSQSRKDRHKG